MAGGLWYVPFPWEAAQAAAASGQPFSQDDLRTALDLPAGFDIASNVLVNAAETYTAERFERVRAKDDPLRDLTLSGSATLHVAPSVRLRLGGTLDRERYEQTAAPAEQYASLLYNRDRLYEAERDARRYFASVRQRLGANVSYQLQADVQQWRTVQYPQGFSADPADALFYGDIDADYNAIARRYYAFRDGQYERLYTTDREVHPYRAAGGFTFFLPGQSATIYRKREGSAFRIAGDATVRLGAHEVEFGGALEQQTHRRFDLAGARLARYYTDDRVEFGTGFATYEALPFQAFRPVAYYYGYDFRGQNEVGSEDIDAYFTIDEATGERGSTDLAPYRPRYYAGYVQDRLMWQALTLDLGLRVEAFDNNAQALKDPYATLPIIRAGSLASAPDGIGDDFAVYFNHQGDVVGYRDLDGNFFNAQGVPVSYTEITSDLSGGARFDENASRAEAFARTPVHVVLEPRLGVRFAVSERASLFAYYSRMARRPPAELYTPFRTYEDRSARTRSSQDRTSLATLRSGPRSPMTSGLAYQHGSWRV